VLMVAGYKVIDVLTPGNLGEVLVTERRRDAGVIVGAAMLGIGLIVASAILASQDDLSHGLAEAAGFGAIGIALMAVAFVAMDKLTPGSLGEIVADEHEDPALAYVTAASLLAVAGIIAAAIS
jgi:uncharacterized membrane protein YjfL (UPF0719 family)